MIGGLKWTKIIFMLSKIIIILSKGGIMHMFKVGDEGVTRDGHRYRVICINANHPTQPIVALVYDDGMELPYTYSVKGEYHTNRQYHLDLMPPTQKGWLNIYKRDTEFLCSFYATEAEATNTSANLFMADYKLLARVEVPWYEGQGLEKIKITKPAKWEPREGDK